MARLYYDSDADLSVLKKKTVAIIGYGNQGRAQALNLRDSGVEVIVGGVPDATFAQAKKDGFSTMTTAEAAAAGDIICLLIPDEVQQQVYREEILPGLEPGDALDFAHGYNIHYGFIALPKEMDVIMVAPRMIGVGVRDAYAAGKPVPAFVAVQQDGSGEAWPKTLALARGMGCTRAGAIESTFAEETELDHFSEHFVWPAMFRILVGGFEFLTEQGYQPEAVLMELWGSKEAAEVLERMAEVGIFGQMDYHSPTSQYGQLARREEYGSVDIGTTMRRLVDEITSGRFADEWDAERDAGYPNLVELRERHAGPAVRDFEESLRRQLGEGAVTSDTAI